MAFSKYARAEIVRPKLLGMDWDRVRVASGAKKLNQSLKKQAEDILGEPFTPERFLLTHATIVCSVDAQKVQGVKTGSLDFEGQKINRKYSDYRVSSDTDKYINNNLDCWSREVIKKSYKTFIGSHNFVEHVQVEELSKGRIIDAVLRDVGESLYVDILVATDKKHKDLVDQIVSGDMNSMSMGCSVDFTICTKCGHVASDDTEMCQHIKYEKGNTFYDEQGHKHRVAELCGHGDTGETGGVTFIEASWVKVPAFKGAVARNTLEIPSEVPSKWVEKTAFGFGGGDDDDSSSDKDESKGSILDQIEGVVTEAVVDRIQKKLKEEIRAMKIKENLSPSTSESTVHENDNVVKEGNLSKTLYLESLDTAIKISNSPSEALRNVMKVNKKHNVKLPNKIYALAQFLGNVNQYDSLKSYVKKANDLNKSPLTQKEIICLVKLSKLLSSRS